MKKIIGMGMFLVIFLTACGHQQMQESYHNEKKQSKIEIYSVQDGELLQIIEEQDAINDLLDMSDWKELESISADLVPEYMLLVYQEKTLLAGQGPEEDREFELIETVITYENSLCVTEIISNTVIKNMIIPESALIFHYMMSEDISDYFELEL